MASGTGRVEFALVDSSIPVDDGQMLEHGKSN
jgi:hypothetical protein